MRIALLPPEYQWEYQYALSLCGACEMISGIGRDHYGQSGLAVQKTHRAPFFFGGKSGDIQFIQEGQKKQ